MRTVPGLTPERILLMQTDHTTDAPQDKTTNFYKCCVHKTCKRFGQLLPLSEFNKSTRSSDGHSSICRECAKEKLRNYRNSPEGKEVKARYQREFRKTEKGRQIDHRGQQKYRQTQKAREADVKRRKRDKDKMKARYVVNRAVQKGNMPRPDTLQCHHCASPAKEYHHYLGYATEHHLDVVPACKQCHARADFDPSCRKYQ
jgi:hypothetical protein